MAVIIGSARIDENGQAHGGKAGDQTGKEVSTQSWYKHTKVWRVFRARTPEVAEDIAYAMQAACDNPKIGYDQYQRDSLYNAAKAVGFNPSRVTTACETDCSALVRVCCAYAGIMLPSFRTTNQPKTLLDSGAFIELKGAKYTDSSDYLRRGDILVTSTQGHTVVVLSKGSKAHQDISPGQLKLGDRTLKNGSDGEDVRELQTDLIKLGFNCGKWGADGDFGDATEMAVKEFQRVHGLKIDGVFGSASFAAMLIALKEIENPAQPQYVEIVGGNCYMRAGAGVSYEALRVVREHTRLEYRGETSEDGWHAVKYTGVDGWVSGKYGKLR